jgi:hypothetical protein
MTPSDWIYLFCVSTHVVLYALVLWQQRALTKRLTALEGWCKDASEIDVRHSIEPGPAYVLHDGKLVLLSEHRKKQSEHREPATMDKTSDQHVIDEEVA